MNSLLKSLRDKSRIINIQLSLLKIRFRSKNGLENLVLLKWILIHFTVDMTGPERKRKEGNSHLLQSQGFRDRVREMSNFRNCQISRGVAKHIQVVAQQQGESKLLEACTMTFSTQQPGFLAEVVVFQDTYTSEAKAVLLAFHGHV